MHFASTYIVPLLQSVVQETFETLTFSEITDWQIVEAEPERTLERISTGIRLFQPVCGLLVLSLSREQCREFVQNVHEIEPDNEPETVAMLHDFMGELINTIAGRLSAELAERGQEIKLGLPFPQEDEGTVFSPKNGNLIFSFDIDGQKGFFRLD